VPTRRKVSRLQSLSFIVRGSYHRHLSNIDCLTARTTCLASKHITNLKQSILETSDIYGSYLQYFIFCVTNEQQARMLVPGKPLKPSVMYDTRLLDPFIKYKENEVLCIYSQTPVVQALLQLVMHLLKIQYSNSNLVCLSPVTSTLVLHMGARPELTREEPL